MNPTNDLHRGRRGCRSVVLLLVAALIVAACGDDGATADAAAAGGGGGSTQSGAFPVSIEHVHGTTVIEERPERVVTVGLVEQDALLALGIVPVATTEWFGEHPGSVWPWAQDELEALGGEVPIGLGSGELNAEAVAAADPDLIVALYGDLSASDYEILSNIAPTIAHPSEYVEYGIPWDELTITVGRAVGEEEEARALVAEVEAAFDAASAAHPEFDGATAVVAAPWEGIWLYGPQDPRGRFLTRLGFTLPDDIEAMTGDRFGGSISPEQAEYLDLDLVVWLDYEDVAGTSAATLYESLPVHTDGREVHLSSFDSVLGGATSFVTVLSLPFLIEGIVPMMAQAVDGDPSTVVTPG